MGCYKSRCKICKKEVKGEGHFEIMLKEMEHIEQKHSKVFEQNKKADLIHKQEVQKALDKMLKNSRTPLFSHNRWDGQDMTDEEFERKTGEKPSS